VEEGEIFIKKYDPSAGGWRFFYKPGPAKWNEVQNFVWRSRAIASRKGEWKF